MPPLRQSLNEAVADRIPELAREIKLSRPTEPDPTKLFHTDNWEKKYRINPDPEHRMHVMEGEPVGWKGKTTVFENTIKNPPEVVDQQLTWNAARALRTEGVISPEEYKALQEDPDLIGLLKRKGYDPALKYKDMFDQIKNTEARNKIWWDAHEAAAKRLGKSPDEIDLRKVSTKDLPPEAQQLRTAYNVLDPSILGRGKPEPIYIDDLVSVIRKLLGR